MLRSLGIFASLASLSLVAPAMASGESYLVGSCKDPAGQPNAALGWVGSALGDGLTLNTCATGGGLVAALNSETPSGGSTASWNFNAPPNTRIVRVLANRATSGFVPAGRAQDVAYVMTVDDQALERCQPANDLNCAGNLTAPFEKPGLSASNIGFRVLCTNAGGACTRRVGVVLSSVWVALEDNAAPLVTNAVIRDNGEDSGTLQMTFDAGDVGGGVYRALVKVDGRVTQAIPLAPAPCADVNPSNADQHEFSVPVPCPLLVRGGGATVDARSLPAGPHGVEVVVEDAAGNQKSALGSIEFPRPNVVSGSSLPVTAITQGRLKMWFVKSHRGTRHSLSSRYGTRVVTRGVLRTPSGRGIVGARIDVYHIRKDGKRRLVKTGLKSRAKGALTLILPNNLDTRAIEYVYRALRPGPVTSSQRLHLTVRRGAGKVYYRKTKG
jgi:hypothetical protein